MRRAQLQAMETIIISAVLVLLVIIGLWFYTGVSVDRSGQIGTQLSQEAANALIVVLSELPELSCPDMSLETRNCLDKTKAELLADALTNPQSNHYSDEERLYYASIFGSANITITQRYPATEPESFSVQLFDGATSSNVVARTLPINLYDPKATIGSRTITLAEIELEVAR